MKNTHTILLMSAILLCLPGLSACQRAGSSGRSETAASREESQAETHAEVSGTASADIQTGISEETLADTQTGVPENSAAAQPVVQETTDPESPPEQETPADDAYASLFDGITLAKSYKGLDDANPLMTQRFGADPFAMVCGDRVYFYMTADSFEYNVNKEIVENTYGTIRSINVISTADMINFTDHGSIRVAGPTGAAKWAHNSWAPAAAWKEIDGKAKFFLYFADAGGGIGVLTADSPTGPFTDPLGQGLITRQTPNCADVLWLFDPAVLVNDDGTAYLYFGGGVPEGKAADPGTGRVVQLGGDMISLAGDPIAIDAPYLFEDSGIHKYNGKYYYTYCSNWQVDAEGTARYGFHNAEIVSLESDSPMGPFTMKETILENPGKYFGLYGNNHHCVFQFKDRWYITYHARTLEKAMGVEHGYRSTHVNQFTMGEDGTIGKIHQSLRGRQQLSYVDPYEINRAACMAVAAGIDCVPANEEAKECGSGDMALGGIDPGDFVLVKGVDFGRETPVSFTARVRTQNGENGSGVIQLRADGPNGPVLGYLPIEETAEDFTEYTAELTQGVTGVHDLCLIFSGEGYEVDSWQFKKQ